MDSPSDFVPNPRSILIVDDNSNLREALVAVLDNAGSEVFQASDGNAAIAEMRQQPVALLITDLVIPEKEGFETMRQFIQEFPRMPMIAIRGGLNTCRSLKPWARRWFWKSRLPMPIS